MNDSTHEHGLLSLPAELLQQIFSYLEPVDLANSAQTCRPLCTASYDEQLWQYLVNRNLPYPASAPTPLNTFRELYMRDTIPTGFLHGRRYGLRTASPAVNCWWRVMILKEVVSRHTRLWHGEDFIRSSSGKRTGRWSYTASTPRYPSIEISRS